MLNSKIFNHLPQTRLNLIKISKNLNRYNSENNNFQSTNERSLKAQKFSL